MQKRKRMITCPQSFEINIIQGDELSDRIIYVKNLSSPTEIIFAFRKYNYGYQIWKIHGADPDTNHPKLVVPLHSCRI